MRLVVPVYLGTARICLQFPVLPKFSDTNRIGAEERARQELAVTQQLDHQWQPTQTG